MRRHKLTLIVPVILISVILITICTIENKSCSSNATPISAQIYSGNKHNSLKNTSTKVEESNYVNHKRENISKRTQQNIISNIETITYTAVPQLGHIGYSENAETDNPVDNIFEFEINELSKSSNKVWLTYEIKGIADAYGISKSINDRSSYGGYVCDVNDGWTSVKEEISSQWLNIGRNRITFTKTHNGQNYSIRNLHIVVESSTPQNLTLSSPAVITDNGVYLHGFISDNIKSIIANGEILTTIDNEFESFIDKNDVVNITLVTQNNDELKQVIKPISKEDVNLIAFNRDIKHTDKKFFRGNNDSILFAGAELKIDSLNISRNLNLSITSLRDNDISPLNYGMSNVTAEDAGYRFLPHGTHFENDGASISLKYDRTKIPAGYTEDDIRTFYFDTDKKQWIALDRIEVDTENLCVVSKTTHFTDMINGVIQAPESPETEGFTPTMMNDIKIADPASGITLIAPPSANNYGSANLEYPIELPPARNGMSPNLVVSYNSDNSDGWLGDGWDIQIPTITVDTRWGVPLYDQQYETETYLLNGEMLCMVGNNGKMVTPHNMSNKIQRTANRQFYTRKGGDFSKIIRLGNNPSNYIWEITDKNGTKYIYGGNDGALKGVIYDINNNQRTVVAEWKLSHVQEVHGDYIEYNYSLYNETQLGYMESVACYLQKIVCGYTTPAKTITQITFNPLTALSRPTQKTSARYGFLTSSNKVLGTILIKHLDKDFKRYTFNYDHGKLDKLLLDQIVLDVFDEDSNPILVSTHNCTYYDDITNTSVYTFESESSNINAYDDDIGVSFVNPLTDLSSKTSPTAIESTKGTSIGGSVYAGVGFPDGSFTKGSTIGVSVGYSQSSSEGINTLIDINGDGLVDKVFEINGSLWFRPLLKYNNEYYYGDVLPIIGIDNLTKSSTSSFSAGAKVNSPAIGSFVAVAGGDVMTSRTTTTDYFSDVNGDGLVDFISGGKTYFNHIENADDSSNMIPVFTLSSTPTPNPILYTGTLPQYSSALLSSESDEIIKNSPMVDAVKFWQAPQTGNVTIYMDLQLLPPDETFSAEPDSVIFSCQKENTVIYQKAIPHGDYTSYNYTATGVVTKGERIYFRLQSGRSEYANGYADKIKFKPFIVYTTPVLSTSVLSTENIEDLDSGTDIDETSDTFIVTESTEVTPLAEIGVAADPNGDFANQYIYSESAVYDANSGIALQDSSAFSLRSKFIKPLTSDDVVLKIIGSSSDPSKQDSVLWSRTFVSSSTSNGYVSINADIDNPNMYSSLRFVISSTSNVKWQAVKWLPEIYQNGKKILNAPVCYDVYANQATFGTYVSMIQPASSSGSLMELQNDETNSFIYEYSLYAKPILNLGTYTGNVTMTIKTTNRLIGKKTYSVVNGVVQDADLYEQFKLPNVSSRKIMQVWCEYFCDGYETDLSGNLLVRYNMYIGPTSTNQSSTSPSTGISNLYSKLSEERFGSMYRGWGSVAYNAKGSKSHLPISPELLEPDYSQDVEDETSIDVRDMTAYSMGVDMTSLDKWVGPNQNIFMNDSIMSCGRLTLQEVGVSNPLSNIVVDQSTAGTGAPGIPHVVKHTSSGTLASAGAFGLGVSLSDMSGHGTTIVDAMDLNGDGFPDIINNGYVKYTNTTGGLSDITKSFTPMSDISSSNSYGSGGNPIHAYSTISDLGKGSSLNAQNMQASNISNGDGFTLNVANAYSTTSNEENITFVDINGDGLPDRVNKNGYIELNLGYRFSYPFSYSGAGAYTHEGNTKGYNAGLGLGFDIGAKSFSGGYGGAWSETTHATDYYDVNNDGLPDKLFISDSKIFFAINNGGGYNNPIELPLLANVGSSRSFSESLSVAATVAFNFIVKIAITPEISASTSISATDLKIMDFDGDGLLDIVSSSTPNLINFRKSSIARTNKLASVQNSLGGKFTIDYSRSNPTYNHPGGKWVMSSVVIDDGISDDGANPRIDFEYGNGVYDRREREFLGFGTVTTSEIDTDNSNSVYRSTIQQYDVSSYYVQGNLLSTEIKDAGGNLYSKESHEYYSYSARATNNNYTIQNIVPSDGVISYTPLRYTKLQSYEGGSTGVIMSESWYGYKIGSGSFGELITYKYSDKGNLGNNGSGTYDYQTTIGYHNITSNGKYIWGLPKTVIVKGNNNSVFRSSSATYNDIGELTQYTQQLDNGSAVTNYTYDNYGNLSQMIYPTDEKGNRLTFEYSYEDTMGMYIKTVTNINENFKSNIDGYDFRYGIPLSKTDVNDKNIFYTVDNLGRILTVLSPMDIPTSDFISDKYTIRFEYYPAVLDTVTYEIKSPAYAITRHYDERRSLTGDSDIETIAFCDGFGRIIQTKKEAMVYNGDESSVHSMIVSGKNIYDSFGRVVKTYYPTSESFNDTAKTQYVTEKDLLPPTEMSYDVLDRTILVKTPIGTETMSEYYLNGNDIVSKVTDAEGNIVEAYTNGSGKTVKTVQYHNNNPINTLFEYDGIGQLISTTDNEGNKTTSVYDMAGRRTQVSHPASGVTSFTYDALDNVLTKQTANMGSTDFIKYSYEFNKLKSIEYPSRPQNNVYYYYGNQYASDGLRNRIIYMEDGSGSAKYSYDELGNVISETRTVIVPNNGIYTFNTQWNYDSFNRLLDMTYPGSNNETVYYNYDLGGNLASVTHNISDVNKQYVDTIFYDKFGSRAYMKYGNGAVTTYAYDSLRRLSNLNVSSANQTIINNNYGYDAVNNITSIVNERNAITNKLGARMNHNYVYDDLYRLISAQGNYNNGTANYELAMGYDDMHRITSKRQTLSRNDMQFDGTLNVGYNLAYTYSDKKKFQLETIQDYNYRTEGTPNDSILNRHIYKYDANGNMVLDSIGRVMNDGHLEENISKRQLLWDDENRLLAINDNGYVSSYLYNANGERTVKLSGNNEAVYVNTIPSANETQTDRFTIYPSPYIVFTNGGRYTKHIYIGSERIVSKVAIDNGYDPRTTPTAAYGNNIYVTRLNNKSTALNDSIEAIYTKFQLPFNGLNNDDIIQGFQPSLMNRAYTMSTGIDNYEEYSYYIHSDHLGSTSYITNSDGEVSQHVEYVPFGEVFIEELSSSAKLNTPYLFNGKEFDEETGLYYYGARYYDPKTSLWLSTDPMELKYPNISTYTYCACNPVKFIDPDGKYILFINGLRLWYGARDQKTFWTNSLGGKTSIYKTDEMNYWSGVNHNKKHVNIPNYYIEQYNDQNIGFTSGSSFWNSDVAHRINDGKIKAQQFHELVQNGEIIIGQNEPIRIIAHSQGAAHAVGFAEQLQTYKDSNGKNLYNIEVIEYIAPHQPTDITHPNGIKGIQYSHPDDQIASKNWWINGGTEFGKIKNIPVFIYQNGRHSVLDNDIFIKNGEKYR